MLCGGQSVYATAPHLFLICKSLGEWKEMAWA